MTDLEKRLNKLRSGEKQTPDYPDNHLSPVVYNTAPKSSLSSRLEQLRAENGVSQQAAQETVSDDEYRKARNDIQIAKNTGDGEALEKAKERFRSLGGDPDTNVIKAQTTRTGSDLLSAAAYITRANPLDSKTDKAAEEYKPNERAFNYLTGKADELSERAARQTESLKKGRTAAGQALVDIGMQGAQLAADAVANAALPGSGMATLAARSFGGAATEARQAGATVNRQKLYGLANAGVELLTEKLSGIMNIAYGKGAADKAVDYFIGKLSNSEAGQAAWRLLFSSLGEGAEEAISDLVNPITKAIYNGRKVKENYSELKGAEVAYDAFIGAVLGFFGGSVEGLTGNVSEEAKFFRNAHDSGLSFKEATNAWAAVEAANIGAQTQEAPDGENIQPTAETAAESENTGQAEAQTQQQYTRDDINAIIKDRARLAELGIDTNGKTASQLRKEAREKIDNQRNNSQFNIDNAAPVNYTESGIIDGGKYNGLGREAESGGPVGSIGDTTISGRRLDGTADTGVDRPSVTEQTRKAMDKSGIANVGLREINPADSAAFSDALMAARKADTKYGVFVAAKSAEDVSNIISDGGKVYMSDDGYIGVAVTKKGDIVAVFKNKQSTHKKAISDILVTAVENGGNRLDCYGRGLVAKYENAGFVPVAKVKFDADIAKKYDGWTDELIKLHDSPYIYFMRHNGDSSETVASNYGNYKHMSLEELDALPTMDYDSAEAYRDWLIDNPRSKIYTEAQDRAPASPDVSTTQNTASPDIAPTQNTQFERLGQEQTYHTIRHDKTVEAEAAAMLKGRSTESVISELSKKEAWNDTDTAAAGKLAEQLVAKINTGKGADAAISELARLRTALEAKVGNAARVLRMRGRRPGTVADFVSDAAKQIAGQKLRNGATKEGICKTVAEYAERYSGISQNKTAESTKKLKDLILDVSDTRNTSGGKSGKAQRELIASAIDKVATQKGGYEFLRDLATVQIRSIAGDYVDRGFINKLKAVRYLNLLSNPVTTNRNVGANTVFANFMEAAGNNTGTIIDALLGRITGNGRTLAFDRGLFSKAFQKGFSEASVRAFLEITLDAESGKANSKYDEIRGSTFKKTGNWLERYFAEIEKLQGYALKLTDEAQKGGTRAEISRGANALYDAAKRAKTGVTSNDIAEMADETAKYRTLQNESKSANTLQTVRRALNDFAHIGNEKTGTFGLGDALAPFAKVPANAVSSTAAVNPIYAAVNAVKLVDILFDVANGKKVSAKKQANTAKSIGRNLNGIGLTVLASVLSAKGVIRNSDDEDRDANALEKSIGKTGAQINLSAAKRWIEGNGSAEWKPDDTVIALGWLPQLNAILIMGDALYNAYSDEDGLTAEEVINSSFKTLFQTFTDFPAVSSISNLIDAYKYSTAENYGGKLKDVGVQFVGDIGTSFAVSNAVAAVARGMDGVERDVYSADTVAEKERNILFSKIPFLRETLPPSLDNFGNEIYTEEQVLNFLNSILLPGKIGTVKDNKAANEVLRLYEATENASTIPDKNPPSSISVKGESHRLTTAEKRAFKETYGQTAQSWISDVMNTGAYKELEDADKAEVITDILSYAKSKATEEYCRKNGIAYSSEYVVLTQGVDKPGTANDKTALKPSEVPNYLLFKSAWGKATDSGDTAAIDRLVRQFNGTASQTLKAAESERIDGVKALVNASKLGVKSADVLAVDKTIESFQADGDRNQPNGSDKFKGLMYANVSDKTRDALAETYLTKERYLAYQYLRGQDVPPKDIYRIFTEIDSNDNGTLSKKECQAAGYNALYEYIKAK